MTIEVFINDKLVKFQIGDLIIPLTHDEYYQLKDFFRSKIIDELEKFRELDTTKK